MDCRNYLRECLVNMFIQLNLKIGERNGVKSITIQQNNINLGKICCKDKILRIMQQSTLAVVTSAVRDTTRAPVVDVRCGLYPKIHPLV